MAKKAKKSVTKKAVRHYTVHKKLEEPVHNLVGYGALFALVVAVFVLVYTLKLFF